MIRDSGRAFLEYEVDPEPNDATLSLSLFEGGKLVEDGGDDTKKVAEGGNDGGSGVDKGLSNMDGAMLERGDSPSSYLRAKKLLSSPSSSEAGELVSVSVSPPELQQQQLQLPRRGSADASSMYAPEFERYQFPYPASAQEGGGGDGGGAGGYGQPVQSGAIPIPGRKNAAAMSSLMPPQQQQQPQLSGSGEVRV